MTTDRSSRFWDRVAERYSRRPVADETAYRKKLEVTRRYLGPDMEVLEFGCGTGSTAILHAPYVKRIRATDVSPRMIDIARGKATAQGVANVSFECAAVEALDVAEGSLDAVLGMSILHLVDDRNAVIARVHRMLAPGGVFITSTMCLGDSMRWFGLVGPLGRLLGVMPQVRIFTVAELKDSLTGAGFDLDHEWQPGRNKGIFIVAKKPG